MATKKPTTKAKTKTPKTKSTKTTKPVAKKAVAAKTQSTKVVKSEKSVKRPSVKRVVDMLALRRMHIFSAVFFVGLAILAGVMMGRNSYQLFVSHLASDEQMSTQDTVFAPAAEPIYDVELRWIVVGIMLLSTILPLLYITKLEGRYSQAVRASRMVPWRWFDFGITMGLILEVVALLSGIQDMFALKLVGGLIFVTCMLGMIAERQNNSVGTFVRSAFYTSIVSGILPWIIIAASAVATVVYGEVRASWYVYALYATTLVGFSALALNQLSAYRKRTNYMDVERNYVVANMLIKIAFALILIDGIRK